MRFVCKVANDLMDMGIGPGESVALELSNLPNFQSPFTGFLRPPPILFEEEAVDAAGRAL